ncbi:MAG: lipase family protein [Campylobacterota bacterium]|nr:lipase family protein [Campylobacterota bacterium]
MIKHIRKSSIAFALVSSLALFSACGIDNTDENTVSGANEFVDAVIIDDINTSVMLQVVRGSIDENATNAFGYKAVKITYNTTNQNDEAVVASGLLVIPTASPEYQAYRAAMGQSPFSVSMICENHITNFEDIEAPSNVEVPSGLPENSTAVLMSGYAGFAAVIPDYIGYGSSKDTPHPYMLKEASARDSLDMVKASIYYMEQSGVALNYQLYISGYSQGGYTAMALAQEVEENFDSVNLMGVAPMAGPYDLEALADIEIDASNTMIYPAFLGYLADSYAYYNDEISLSDVVLEEDTQMYHNLFLGSNNNIAIHTSLGLTENYGFGTYTADALFKTTLIDDYKNSINTGGVFREALVENSTDDWVPQAKMNLIHCDEDEIIPFSIAQDTYSSMVDNGAENITLTSIPTDVIAPATESAPLVHQRCGSTAYGAAVQWFAAIRNGDL